MDIFCSCIKKYGNNCPKLCQKLVVNATDTSGQCNFCEVISKNHIHLLTSEVIHNVANWDYKLCNYWIWSNTFIKPIPLSMYEVGVVLVTILKNIDSVNNSGMPPYSLGIPTDNLYCNILRLLHVISICGDSYFWYIWITGNGTLGLSRFNENREPISNFNMPLLEYSDECNENLKIYTSTFNNFSSSENIIISDNLIADIVKLFRERCIISDDRIIISEVNINNALYMKCEFTLQDKNMVVTLYGFGKTVLGAVTDLRHKYYKLTGIF